MPRSAEQSISCCSLNDRSDPVPIANAPSADPTVEKAQHEPQVPWFLTGVTAFLVRQSTGAGSVTLSVTVRRDGSCADGTLKPQFGHSTATIPTNQRAIWSTLNGTHSTVTA